jgi:hypothetical protein
MMNLIKATLVALLTLLCPATLFAAGVLDPLEEADALFMREEEKLAHDVYIRMDQFWNQRVFSNIAQSEQRHMDAMLNMLKLYDLPDPAAGKGIGEFTNPSLQALYDDLVADGSESVLDAYYVGALIEETDIRDIDIAIGNTNEQPLIDTYSNLLAGSRNHLRAFVSHIEKTGIDYQPVILSIDAFNAIMEGLDELPVPPDSFSINAGLNDTWYYPATAGQGFAVTVFPGVKLVSLLWFTYDTVPPSEDATAVLGNPGQRWLVAHGSFDGAMAELEVNSMSGGLFDDPNAQPIPSPTGSILLQFDNCNSGSVTYDLVTTDGSLQGFIPIERVNSDNVARCEQEGKQSREGKR